MATINDIVVSGSNKYFGISGGVVSEITRAELAACGNTSLVYYATNSAQQAVRVGEARFCSGVVFMSVISSWVQSQPSPISYSISGSSGPIVLGRISYVADGDQPSPTQDPNFGGEPGVVSPEVAPPPGSPSALPSGNGNTGFTTSGSAGSETGIGGGNT